MSKRLTIVVLTYNRAHRLHPILSQLTAAGVPIIAVDNGSHDGTLDVLRAYPDLEVVALPVNIGAAGRNVGAQRCTTPYVAFCDDDGWYEPDGLALACDLLDRFDRLALVNARILFGRESALDPISIEMADSPLPDRGGIPGSVLMSFMAGAVIVRRSAFLAVGGYDERYFIGGEEETVALPLAKAGWHMRYVPEVVMHHRPSLANAHRLRAFGMRNTLVNAWLHRRWTSAARWTLFTLADTPKNRDYVRGIALTLRALPWILRERRPATPELDADLLVLDRRRFGRRRPLLTRRGWQPSDAGETPPSTVAAASDVSG